MFCFVCFSVCMLKEGSSQVLLHYFLLFFHGSGCRRLLPQKQAANNKARTAGCGASGHLEPREEQYLQLLPPRWLACFRVSVGGHVSSRLCGSDLKYLVERWSCVLIIFFPLQTSSPSSSSSRRLRLCGPQTVKFKFRTTSHTKEAAG